MFPLDELFDLNQNGQLDAIEQGMEFGYMEEMERKMNAWNENDEEKEENHKRNSWKK